MRKLLLLSNTFRNSGTAVIFDRFYRIQRKGAAQITIPYQNIVYAAIPRQGCAAKSTKKTS